jgi:hypothetical protein
MLQKLIFFCLHNFIIFMFFYFLQLFLDEHAMVLRCYGGFTVVSMSEKLGIQKPVHYTKYDIPRRLLFGSTQHHI